MPSFFSIQTVESISILTFLTIIFLCFLKYLLWKHETESKGIQKIIGGLAVFVVALLSSNMFVQMVSLFIGGLIIASEEFMQNLAIIVRSQSSDIGKNLSASKPTPQEIQEKKEKEVAQAKSLERKKNIKPRAVRHDTITVENLEMIENKVAEHFQNLYGDRFVQNAKLTFANGKEILVDGVVFNQNQGIQHIIEIKHIYELKTAIIPLEETEKLFDRLNIHTVVIVCFVVDKTPTQKEVIDFYNESRKLQNVNVGVFELKNGKLKTLLIP